MNNSNRYTVSIVKDEESLNEAFYLRYNVYKKTYPLVTNKLPHPFETDGYDLRSIHLGLYSENGSEKKLAGYCRIILPVLFKSNFSGIIVKEHPKYIAQKKIGSCLEKLALIEHMPNTGDKVRIQSLCDSFELQRDIYAEISRFIIDVEHRSLLLPAFFISGMIAICQLLNIKYTFFQCDPHHIAFYQRIGLLPLTGISEFETWCFGTRRIIFGCESTISNSRKSGIESFKEEFLYENKITFNPCLEKAA